MKTFKYLVYRVGSNTANQPSTYEEPLCIVEAASQQKAREIAEKNHPFYSNQSSYAVPESRWKKTDVSAVWHSEGMAHLEECYPLAEGILATSEPQIYPPF